MKRLLIYICIAVSLSLASCVKEELPSGVIHGETPPTELLELSVESISAEIKGGEYDVIVKSRYMPEFEASEPWITFTYGDKLAYDVHLKIKVKVNNSETRSGLIRVTIRDDEFGVEYSKQINIVQKGKSI